MFNALANSNGAPNGQPAKQHTITALKRWSCDDKEMPSVSTIKAIHVYDFDNTLFASPLPNRQLWNGSSVGDLQSQHIFLNGGWWHDSAILAATGEGVEKEEARGWKGWWNEQIVSLVELTMQQKDALAVLLTGRAEAGFAELIKRIVRSRKLEFDMICLKPAIGPANQTFTSTMNFKQELLKDIVHTYREAEEVRIYEDRVKHTKAFRDFFFQFNKDLMAAQTPQSRKPFVAEVVQVTENATQLDPPTEVAEVQRMINNHNAIIKAGNAPPGTISRQIKKTVFYTGYMIPAATTDKLVGLVKLSSGNSDSDMRLLGNSILITPKPCPKTILDKVGGLGAKVVWKVTGIACLENKVWAARVEPVPSTQKYYSENPTPAVVLGVRKGGRPADAARIQNWQPVSEEHSYKFVSTVGEKMVLRIEQEQANESEYESYFPNKNHSPRNGNNSKDFRPQHGRDERRGYATSSNYRGGNQSRGGRGNAHRNHPYVTRGGRGGHGRGGASGGRGRGRGGGGQSQYKSLDDVGDRNYGQPNYDDPNSFY
ncbi:hypothetical protein EJ04DRAFT_429329 [Polyplosphaeria fusca]|uniref:Swiss Army Knife RNA repair protein HAD domain-containing protein n=1 Tax=Polyplosphaeria fusca TaxID=682080 RepID=A0A9P4R7T9_9PLEO|nr:hypothetical protein EJ04DRAFT_429329 [Polyplosphaeria fusca]